MKICFVCLGNICRSPTAEAVFRVQAEAAGRHDIEVDSAGTGAWHVGASPDERSSAEARRHGVELEGRARLVHAGDFEYFDLLVAMDRANRDDLLELAPSAEARARVHLLRRFEPDRVAGAGEDGPDLDVPDPYYGGRTGFADVYAIIERSCAGLLAHVSDPSNR